MFSAFSSIEYHSTGTRTPADAAVRRLDGIGHVLADLDMSAIHTQDEMTRALWTLETADKCIRAILAEFRTEPATDQLVRTSRNLIDQIELARDEVTSHRG
ncbi:hypothetical protein QA641_26695 [Bradyrhizobium sp. CB1650]|uniref:hypothetical protein n=1 Tax=Bradyrhizobium sp. CB1650 TaxID=3039153 RepID=UPI002434C428|nr:hypothetical protein [Bradyrhizobium sp. CB1650]WGD49218.1 hypothetical protein QA641_26695 [Bradyrhizobium sp. CB1650]